MNKLILAAARLRMIPLTLLLLLSSNLFAQKGTPPEKTVTATVTTRFAQHEPFSEKLLTRLKVEKGYTIHIAATGLGKPRMMAVNNDGNVYITRRDQGDVLLISQPDSSGRFRSLRTVFSNFKGVHGIAIKDDFLFLCSNNELIKAPINKDGSLQAARTILKNLPDGGQHGNRYIAFGPDGKLYLSIGSDCNDCSETNPEHATIVQTDTGGVTRKIFARGLRNTIGFDWHPVTKELWGIDNGTDWRGDEIPPEELNRIVENGDYGWPLVFGKRSIDETREDPPGMTKEKYAATTEPTVINFPAHSAPINFIFLKNNRSLSGDAIVTWHGSWNRTKPEGFKVQRIHFENNQPVSAEDFFWGFYNPENNTRFGRPAGLAQDKIGNIYISDDANGILYLLKNNNQ